MKERSKAERIELRKRKRRFLAFIIAMLIGCLPTATVFADDIIVDDIERRYDSLSNAIQEEEGNWKDINVNEKIQWTTKFASGFILYVYYLDPSSGKYEKMGETGVPENGTGSVVMTNRDITSLKNWKYERADSNDDAPNKYVKFYLKAILNPSTITFNANGGTVTPTSGTTDTSGKLSSLPTPFWSGHDFKGWFTKATGGDQVTTNTVFTSNDTIYAQWDEEQTCTVTFDTKGHGTALDPVKVNKGEKVNKPEDPTAEGWNFGGWFTDEDFQNEYDFNTPVEKSFTLYAFWTEDQPDICTVYFYRNGHGRAPRPQNVEKGNKAEKPKDPSADGYDFGGWYEEKECRNKYDFNKPVTQDIDLYAKWTKNDDGSGHDDDDDDDDDDAQPFKPNPDALIAFYYLKNGTLDPKAKIGKEVQGAAANAAFKMAVPAGWKEAFTFSMSNEDKHTYTLKDGTIKLYVPEGFQKAGRKYAILAMGQNGAVKLLSDTDTLPYWITVNPNMEGYAFELIYMD